MPAPPPSPFSLPFGSVLARVALAIVAAAVLTGSCLSGLGWWVEGDGADPAWDKPGVPEKTREAIEEVERQQEGTRAIEEAK